MAYSSFKILFSESDESTGVFPSIGTIVSILETSTSTNFKETLKSVRSVFGEFEKPIFSGGNYNTYLGKTLATAFNLDFNQESKYSVTFADFEPPFNGFGRGTCTVTALYPNAVFEVDPLNVLPSNIRVQINNVVSADIIVIGNESFLSASTDQCELVKVSVPTTATAFKVVSPIVDTTPDNPVVFDINRGQTIQFIVENSDGVQSQKQIQLPDYLSSANFTISQVVTPSGATATVSGINTFGLTLEYSLNNTTWQSENVFTGLSAGNFTLYVRDQLSCQFSKPFTVNEFSNNDISIPVPFHYVSKSNPFRFALRDGGNSDDSLLSYESTCEPMYCEKQEWLNTDIIKTQFKSNFSTLVANVVKPDGTKDIIYPNKMSYNRDIKDKRQARIVGIEGDNSKTGIYFTTGNTYDYDTNDITGTYGLYGGLPEWGVIGNYFKIDTTWYKIEDIIYDFTKQANVLVFSLSFVENLSPIIVSTIYDRFNYDVYEFDVDFSAYNNMDVQIEIVMTDLNYDTITYLSEKQQIKSVLGDLLEIRYYNTGNTDIFYATGFRGLLRLSYQYLKIKVDGENDRHKTDTNVFLLDAVLNEVDEIRFEPLTKEMARKLARALSHEVVGVNGVGYVINGMPTIDGLGFSNIYNFSADMIKTGNVYNAVIQDSDELSTAAPVDIPNLVITENGFIAY